MKKTYLERVELKGIHKRYDLNIDFCESLNVLHGQNGTGKSTLIHIIANVANCDFVRFAFLEFERIKVFYSNGSSISLFQLLEEGQKAIKVEASNGESIQFLRGQAIKDIRDNQDDRFSRDYVPELTRTIKDFVEANQLRCIETSYFPAFRTMLEAWSSQNEITDRHLGRRPHAVRQATSFSRNLFGEFLPTINYPSPIDIENSLRNEIRDAQIRIARYESSVFSDSFVKVFSALLNGGESDVNTDELLAEISELTVESTISKLGDFEDNSKTYQQLRQLVGAGMQSGAFKGSAAGALAVYRDALKERQEFQAKTFSEIDKYFNVVNSFLEKKELAYELDKKRRIPKVGLKFPDNTWSNIKVMSSGERQLLTMLYAVNKMSGNSAVLIDEPEISLHIDWQEELLEKMMEQLGDRQVIVCTHSPSIAADFDEFMKEVVPVFNDSGSSHCDDIEEEDLL